MRIVVALFALLLAACAGPRAGGYARELEPGTFLTAAGEPLSPAALAHGLVRARYVLVGEGHDNPCDHRAQAEVVQALAERQPVVGLEMVSTERQEILDRFAAGELDASELGEALDWKRHWGLPYEIYLPIFEAAAAAGLQVAALNLPKEEVRRFSSGGTAELPDGIGELILPPEEQEPMLREAFAAHGEGDEAAWNRFVRVQSLWDTAMAQNAITFGRRFERPVVILAGAGHVQNGWGIGHRLRRLDPGAEVVEIVPWRGTAPIDPAAGAFSFYCPARE